MHRQHKAHGESGRDDERTGTPTHFEDLADGLFELERWPRSVPHCPEAEQASLTDGTEECAEPTSKWSHEARKPVLLMASVIATTAHSTGFSRSQRRQNNSRFMMVFIPMEDGCPAGTASLMGAKVISTGNAGPRDGWISIEGP